MKHPMFLIAVVAFATTACQREADSNANAVANETAPANAQQAQTPPGVSPAGPGVVQVANKDEIGAYLVDASGRSLYLLEPKQESQLQAKDAENCTDACLGEWPPYMVTGAPEAGGQVNSSMLGTVQRDTGQQVTYNGWPLYYYRGDRDPGSTSGQHVTDRWGEWYLVSPAGEPVEAGRERQLGSAVAQ